MKNNESKVISEGINEMISRDIQQMSKNVYHLCKEQFDLEVVGKRLFEQFEQIQK